MKARIFLMGAQNLGSCRRLETELKYVFSDYLTDNGGVSSFYGIKEATADIAKAVTDAHALIFIADYSSFGATKLMLSKAFGFELSCDPSLLQKACETCEKDPEEEDYEFSVTHAFVPSNTRTFVLSDGKFAGFSVANGNQTIILIPYEKDRTSVLLASQVIPYLNATYHVSIDFGKLKELNSQMLLSSLEKNASKIAVAGTNTASFFKDYVGVNEKLSAFINISPIAEKRGSMQPIDYVVNLSITAAELLSCRYGVAMSNAFYTGDSPDSEKIVYLAVTNERETAVREIHSFVGEDISSFLNRCSGDFCAFISDIISNDEVYVEDNAVREKAAEKRYKIAIASVAAVILAVAVFCFSYFYTNNYSITQWANNFIEWIFPAGNPFEGMFDRFVPGEDEEQAQADIDADAAVSDSDASDTQNDD
ncbi:MAG: hypothetical protein IKL10_11140 [Clostridia bacterium]|nr:hypothetical protein [Clostridia bacterium]